MSMTPERIEEKKRLHEYKHPDCAALITVGEFNLLLAALEESQQQLIEKTKELAGANVLINGLQISAERQQQFAAEQAERINEIKIDLREAQQTIAQQHSKEYGIFNTADCEMFTASKEEVWNYLQNNTTVFQCYSVVMDGKTVITSEPSAGANGKLDECTLDEFFQRFEDEDIVICRLAALGNKEGSDKA
ncbi:hypothetical protein NSQ29_01520 [Paenibacillus sp. FSL F4-0236]|uniref:hypothetical protein n=1 Tax=Paenibacillus sp. FSL F4-0236 TaxID=2954731 RepID=UPI0030F806CE